MMIPVTFWKLVNKPFSVAYVMSLLDTAEIPRFLVRFIILFQQRQVPKIRKCCNQCACAQFIWKFKSDRNHGRKREEISKQWFGSKCNNLQCISTSWLLSLLSLKRHFLGLSLSCTCLMCSWKLYRFSSWSLSASSCVWPHPYIRTSSAMLQMPFRPANASCCLAWYWSMESRG